MTRLRQRELSDLWQLHEQWDRLAALAANPFLTVAWLYAWGMAFPDEDPFIATLEEANGKLLAGACLVSPHRGQLAAAVNAHTTHWDAVAADDDSRRLFWQEIGRLRQPRVDLHRLAATGVEADGPRSALRAAGYRLVAQDLPGSPTLDLPSSFEELMRSVSRNLRSQVGRRRRALEQEGELMLRETRGGGSLERDLEAFFRVEASGWKQLSRTAILADPPAEALYRGFVEAAARDGWLRLYLLELDGEVIAADLGCAIAGHGYLIKTGFDERYSRLSPGLVLRAEALRASIDEGLSVYDFLGGPDPYKLRWANGSRPHVTIRAFRGPRGAAPYAWWAVVRPTLTAVREHGRVLRRRYGRARS